jgi:hypothetical protein
MKKRKTANELAEAWRQEKLDFTDALIQHLIGNLGLVPDLALILGIQMAVSYVNSGQGETALDLPGYQEMTAGEIVAKFGLEPFLDSTG